MNTISLTILKNHKSRSMFHSSLYTIDSQQLLPPAWFCGFRRADEGGCLLLLAPSSSNDNAAGCWIPMETWTCHLTLMRTFVVHRFHHCPLYHVISSGHFGAMCWSSLPHRHRSRLSLQRFCKLVQCTGPPSDFISSGHHREFIVDNLLVAFPATGSISEPPFPPWQLSTWKVPKVKFLLVVILLQKSLLFILRSLDSSLASSQHSAQSALWVLHTLSTCYRKTGLVGSLLWW